MWFLKAELSLDNQKCDHDNMNNNAKKISGFEVYSRLLRYVRYYWFAFALGVFGTIVASGVDAGLIWSLKPLLDKGFMARDQWFTTWLPLFVILAFVLRGAAGFCSD